MEVIKGMSLNELKEELSYRVRFGGCKVINKYHDRKMETELEALFKANGLDYTKPRDVEYWCKGYSYDKENGSMFIYEPYSIRGKRFGTYLDEDKHFLTYYKHVYATGFKNCNCLLIIENNTMSDYEKREWKLGKKKSELSDALYSCFIHRKHQDEGTGRIKAKSIFTKRCENALAVADELARLNGIDYKYLVSELLYCMKFGYCFNIEMYNLEVCGIDVSNIRKEYGCGE